MYKLCKTEQSARRQRELEQGLLEAMKQQRYEDISVSDLCQKLQVPRKTFYRYFDSKDGALYGLIDHSLMEYETFTASQTVNEERTVEAELERFFLFWMDKKPLLDALRASGLSGILIERAVSFALTGAVIPPRVLPQDSEEIRRHITMFGVCGLLSMVMSWHSEGYAKPASGLALIAARLLARPLFPQMEQTP